MWRFQNPNRCMVEGLEPEEQQVFKSQHRWSTNEKRLLRLLWVVHSCSSPLPAALLFCLQLEDTEAHLFNGPERKLRNGSAQGQRFQVGYSSVHTVRKKKKKEGNARPHCQAVLASPGEIKASLPL